MVFSKRGVPLLAGAVAGVLAAILFVALLGGTREARARTPTGSDVDALMRRVSASLAHDCKPATPDGAAELTQRDPSLLAAPSPRALVICEPVGTGADHLAVWRFADAAGVQERLAQWTRFLNGPRGTCTEDQGDTQWADRQGTTRGELLCGTSASERYVVWSNDAEHLVFEASADSLSLVLQNWWRTYVRPQASFPTAAEQALLTQVGKVVAKKHCQRDEQDPSSLATASIVCWDMKDASGHALGADDLWLQSFRSPPQLQQYSRDFDAEWGRYASGDNASACGSDHSYLNKSAWYHSGGLRGTLLCFPAYTDERFAWTLDRSLLFGLLFRSDQDPTAAMRAWSKLADIGQ